MGGWIGGLCIERAPPSARSSNLITHHTTPHFTHHSSLNETGQGLIADGLLTDTIRRLKSFGVTLLPLDIRQARSRGKYVDACGLCDRRQGGPPTDS